MKVVTIIPAAGFGTRMGRVEPEKSGTSRKQFMLLDGSPILIHTIRKFVGLRSGWGDHRGIARGRSSLLPRAAGR